MKTFKDLQLGDIAWIIDKIFNTYEVKLMSKYISEGFTDNIITYRFHDMSDTETLVSLYESGKESDKNWAYCNGGKIYLDKEPILKILEDKLKDVSDMINYLKK